MALNGHHRENLMQMIEKWRQRRDICLEEAEHSVKESVNELLWQTEASVYDKVLSQLTEFMEI